MQIPKRGKSVPCPYSYSCALYVILRELPSVPSSSSCPWPYALLRHFNLRGLVSNVVQFCIERIAF